MSPGVLTVVCEVCTSALCSCHGGRSACSSWSMTWRWPVNSTRMLWRRTAGWRPEYRPSLSTPSPSRSVSAPRSVSSWVMLIVRMAAWRPEYRSRSVSTGRSVTLQVMLIVKVFLMYHEVAWWSSSYNFIKTLPRLFFIQVLCKPCCVMSWQCAQSWLGLSAIRKLCIICRCLMPVYHLSGQVKHCIICRCLMPVYHLSGQVKHCIIYRCLTLIYRLARWSIASFADVWCWFSVCLARWSIASFTDA